MAGGELVIPANLLHPLPVDEYVGFADSEVSARQHQLRLVAVVVCDVRYDGLRPDVKASARFCNRSVVRPVVNPHPYLGFLGLKLDRYLPVIRLFTAAAG